MAVRPRIFFAAATALVALAAPLAAQLRAPFPCGYGMGSLGTIAWDGGPAGRQPWTPAALLRDTLRWGVGVSGIDYYDDMDNRGDADIRHANGGGWFHGQWAAAKVAVEHFDALDVYFEQLVRVSVGVTVRQVLSVSLEATGMRAGLYACRDERETVVTCGATLWYQRRHVAFMAQVTGITLEDAGHPGFAPDPVVRVGVHTARHRFGALGAVAQVCIREEPVLRVSVGHEYWIHPVFGFTLALTTEPFMWSCGVLFQLRRCGTSVSFVHHPVLGWSKGVAFDYAR